MNKFYAYFLCSFFFVPLIAAGHTAMIHTLSKKPITTPRQSVTIAIDVNSTTPYHQRIYQAHFFQAVHNGDTNKIKNFTPCLVLQKDENDDYPLHVTLQNGHLPAALALTRMGASISTVGKTGQSAVELAQAKLGRLAAWRLQSSAYIWNRQPTLLEQVLDVMPC